MAEHNNNNTKRTDKLKEKSTFEQAAEVKIATTQVKKEILPKLGGG